MEVAEIIEPMLRTGPGAAVYSPLVLRLYDAWVLGFSNRWAWSCSTRSVLLPFYRKHVGARHLEVGVGTGYYPAHVEADGSGSGQLTLLDMNEHCLVAAANRLGRRGIRLIAHDVMKKPARLAGEHYDSIALFYLLHCLPGGMAEKSRIFGNLKNNLSPDGIMFGATVLGDDAKHNLVGKILIKKYNKKGIFNNRTDSVDNLRRALCRHFAEVHVEQQGVIALFSARSPIHAS